MPRTFKTPEAQQTYETTVLGSFQAQELSVTSKEQYAQLLCEALIKASDANLSKTSYRLLNHLNALYPFSGSYFELPSQGELALRLGVTRQSINSAQAEIQAAGLWDFKIERWKGRNLMVRDASKVTTKADRCKKDLTPPESQGCKEESTGCKEGSTGCKEESTPPTPEPLLEAGSGPSQISIDLLNLKDPEREDFISFPEPKEPEPEVAAAPPTIAESFEKPICEPALTQGGECSAAAPPELKTYVSSETPKNRPKLKTHASSEARALTNSAKPVRCDTAAEFVSPTAELLERRRQMLAQLFEQGQLTVMGEQLKDWLRLKDCSIHELLRHRPEWGFSLKHGRIVRAEVYA